MSLLGGDIAALFGTVFGSFYLDATLYRVTQDYAEDGELTVSEIAVPCKAQVDAATEAMRGAVGFADTDSRIIILSATLSGTVNTDDEIVIDEGAYRGVRYSIASITRDPAASVWDCRGRYISELSTDEPIIRYLSGGLTGDATLYAALHLDNLLSGTVSGAGMASGGLANTTYLSGSVTGASSLSSALSGGANLSGSTAGQSTLTGTLGLTVQISGTVAGLVTLAGSLSQTSLLTGGISGAGTPTGSLSLSNMLSGNIAGASVLLGAITAASAYDTDAQAYFTAAGVTDTTEKDQVNAFIVGAKADGFWSKLDRLGIFAASTSPIALRDVRNPAKTFATINSPAFTSNRGYTGDGSTSYLSFGEAYTAAGNQYALNDAAAGMWCNQAAALGLIGHIGTDSGTNMRIAARGGTGNETFTVNDAGSSDALQANTGSRVGYRSSTRSGSAIKQGYFNGAQTANLTTVSTALPAGTACVLRSASGFAADRTPAAWFGASFTATDHANMYARLNTLLTSRGAN